MTGALLSQRAGSQIGYQAGIPQQLKGFYGPVKEPVKGHTLNS